MKHLLVTAQLPQRGIELLKKEFLVTEKPNLPEDEIVKIIPEMHALVVRSETQVTKRIIEAGTNLEIIGRAGMGTDNIDSEAAKARNIKVMNTPNANSLAVAELVIGIMLSLSRHIHRADSTMKQGEWAKKALTGREISGKTLGLIGVGNIGKLVARFAQTFNMEILGYDPFLPAEKFSEYGIKKMEKLEELLPEADFISLHVPKNAQTTNLISKPQLAMMKKTAILINCARGGIVNEADLSQALTDGTIAAAGIDTWENEPPQDFRLAKLPNVLAIPHLGASTIEAQERCVFDLIEQITAAFNTERQKAALH